MTSNSADRAADAALTVIGGILAGPGADAAKLAEIERVVRLAGQAAARAGQESRDRSERARAGAARRRAAGLPVGRQPGARDRAPRRTAGYIESWGAGGARRAAEYHEHWSPGQELVKHRHAAGRTPHEHTGGQATGN